MQPRIGLGSLGSYAVLAVGLLTACGDPGPPSVSPRPEHPLNGVEDVEALEVALARYPHVERCDLSLTEAVWVAGPEGTEVRTEYGGAGWPIEMPFAELTVAFPGRTHRVTNREAVNGELWVDGELHAGWGFVLTADDGLATFPFGSPWVDYGKGTALEAVQPPATPPPRWSEATTR